MNCRVEGCEREIDDEVLGGVCDVCLAAWASDPFGSTLTRDRRPDDDGGYHRYDSEPEWLREARAAGHVRQTFMR